MCNFIPKLLKKLLQYVYLYKKGNLDVHSYKTTHKSYKYKYYLQMNW